MTNNDTLLNKIENRTADIPVGNKNLPAKTEQKDIYQRIREQEKSYELILPEHLPAKRFIRRAEAIVKQNPMLQKCTADSVIISFLRAAEVGLEPCNGLGHCWIIPRKENGVWKANFQLGYKGAISLFHNSQNADHCDVMEVYENDEFYFEYGYNPKLYHKPAYDNTGKKVIYYYAYAKMIGGTPKFRVWSVPKAMAHAQKYSDAYRKMKETNNEKNVWHEKKNQLEMIKKSVLDEVLDGMPLNPKLIQALNEAPKHYEQHDSGEIDIIDMPFETVDYEVE